MGQAQLISDAFGAYDPGQEPERALWSGLQISEDERVFVQPQAPDTLLLYLGEKSHGAGRGFGMTAVMGYDALGNPIADGLAATFYLGSQPDTLSSSTKDGLAFKHFDAGTTAGLFQASIEVGDRQTERLIYRVTADVDTVDLSFAEDQDTMLDPTLYGQLETAPLLDMHGNRLGDSFGMQFMLEDPDGKYALIPATIVNDVGKVRFLTSGLNEEQMARAFLGVQISKDLELGLDPVKPKEKTPLYAVYREELGLLEMLWGPVTTNTGAMLIDGSRADFLLERQNEPLAVPLGLSSPFLGVQSWVETGYARANLVVSPANFPVRVTVDTPLGPQVYEFTLEEVLQ